MIQITQATPDDAELLHQLTFAAFREYIGVLQPPTGVLDEDVAAVRAGIVAGGGLIAWIDGDAVGSLRFSPERDHLYVGRLAVLPEHRRAGVGAALIAAAADHARTLGSPAVRVGVRSALPGNIAFFTRLGFIHRETVPHPRYPAATSVTLELRIADGAGGDPPPAP